jgi:hypothetical protein
MDVEAVEMPEAAPAKRKKNQNIKVEYVAANGEASKGIPEDVVGVKVEIVGLLNESITFGDLPASIQAQALAFGLNTVLRNECNTAPSKEDGAVNLADRLEGFRAGIWRPTGDGEGGGIPLVVDAMVRAFKDAGHSDEGIAIKREGWIEKYNLLDKDGKKAQREAWMNVDEVKLAFNTIKAERAAARLKSLKDKLGNAPQDGGGLANL